MWLPVRLGIAAPGFASYPPYRRFVCCTDGWRPSKPVNEIISPSIVPAYRTAKLLRSAGNLADVASDVFRYRCDQLFLIPALSGQRYVELRQFFMRYLLPLGLSPFAFYPVPFARYLSIPPDDTTQGLRARCQACSRSRRFFRG